MTAYNLNSRQFLFPAGTAALPAYTFLNNNKNGMYLPTTNTLGFATAGTNALYIDASQNVGIGTTSPSSYGKLTIIPSSQVTTVAGANQFMIGENSQTSNYYLKAGYALLSSTWTGVIDAISAGSGTNLAINPTGGNVGIGTTSPQTTLQVRKDANNAASYAIYTDNGSSTGTPQAGIAFASAGTIKSSITAAVYNNDFMTFNVGSNTERMRIDSSGGLIVGATSQSNARTNGGTYLTNSSFADIDIGHASGTPSGYAYMQFFYANTQIGQIYQAGTTGVTYLGTSDYRLKENVTQMTNGLATIAALKPVNYIWKSDKSVGEGFIAHELQEVIPIAVGGEKDAVDEDGKIIPQGIDMSRIVPHLVAAIQETVAKIDALETRLSQLESK